VWFFQFDHVYATCTETFKMNKMTGIFYNILECSLKTKQHITVLSRSVKSKVLNTSWTTNEQAT